MLFSLYLDTHKEISVRYLIFLLLLSSSNLLAEYSVKEIQVSEKALSLIESKNTQQALQILSEGLKSYPESDLLHFNLGHVFLSDNKIDSAMSSFLTAAKFSKNQQIKFSSFYNVGLIYQLQKKNDEAIAAYQKALDFNPESKETKINIELMTQQQSGGEGDSENQEQNEGQSGSNKDEKNQGDKSGDNDDKQKKDDESDQNKEKDKQPPKVSRGQAPKPEFNSKELTPSDVNKILNELKQQEQKIRSEYNKQSKKEKINGKDW